MQNDVDNLIEAFGSQDKNGVEEIIDEFTKENAETDKEASQTNIFEDKQKNEMDYDNRMLNKNAPSGEHRVIDKLDEINKESEEKVNKLFEYLEAVTEELDKTEKLTNNIKPYLEKHKDFMEYFSEHFPKVVIKDNYEYFKNIVSITSEIENSISAIRSNIFNAMDTLQFQDITRQKIERVIGVIKALQEYLNSWFDSSSYDDKPRARTAHTIVDEKDKNKVDESVEDIIKQMQEKGEI